MDNSENRAIQQSSTEVAINDESIVQTDLDQKLLDEKVQPNIIQSGVSNIEFYLKFISVGQYPTKLFIKGQDTQSSVIGGILTLLCIIIIGTFAVINVISVFDLSQTFLDEDLQELQSYNILQDGTKFEWFLNPCNGKCRQFTMGQVVNLLFNNSYIELDLPSWTNPQTICPQIKVEATYMNKQGVNEVFNFGFFTEMNNPTISQCLYYLPMLLMKIKNTTFLEDIYIFNKYNFGYEYRFGIEIQIKGVPVDLQQQTKFNIKSVNEQITKNLILQSTHRTIQCTDGQNLIHDFRLFDLFETNKVFMQNQNKKNSLHLQATPAAQCQSDYDKLTKIIFQTNPLYTDIQRYPKSLVSALIEIGGLLAVFQISIALSLLHKFQFYNELSKDKTTLNNLKQRLTLENLDKAMDEIDELKVQNQQLEEKINNQQEIIDALRKKVD